MFRKQYRHLVFAALILPFSAFAAASERVDAKAFKALIESQGGIVLDVRTQEEVAQGRIGDPSVIDYYAKDFDKRLSLLPRDTPIYVYCRSGGRSSATLNIMERMGFTNTTDLVGGIGAWKDAGFPVVKTAQAAASPAKVYSKTEIDTLAASDKPLLLAFQTKWCAPCRTMKPIIESFADSHRDACQVLTIDADANEALMSRYSVKGVPTFVLIQNDEERWRGSGAFTAEELSESLEN